jgi:endonuclease/exonuclease/phosphatase family metal-dependent hydrolase
MSTLVALVMPIALTPAHATVTPNSASPSLAVQAGATDPMRLKQIGSKVARVQVQWKATRKTTKYLVEAFADIRLKKLIASKRVKGTTAWIGGGKIAENQKLWIRVTTIDRPKKLKSAKIKVYTGVREPAAPTQVAVKPTSPSATLVTWQGAKFATGYTVQFSATPNGDPVYSRHVDGPAESLEVDSLAPAALGLGLEFFVTVKADRLGKTFATSAPVPASLPFPPPPWAPAFNVNVGSYNVLGATYVDGSGRSYWDRLPLLAGAIRDMSADIVAVQEAAWTFRAAYPDRPVRALANAAGMSLASTPGTSTACAVTSNHILYNSGAFSVEACGEDVLTVDSRYPCTSTWALMRHLATGQPVLVVSTHLTVGAGLNDLRLAETNLLIEDIRQHNPADYPVIVAGDFNAAALRFPVTPSTMLANAGLLSTDLVAREVFNGQYGTTHRPAPVNTNGERIDFIFTSPKVMVNQFAVRFAEPSAAQPSDHYPVWASLTVYS